jgi:hypothetical protein
VLLDGIHYAEVNNNFALWIPAKSMQE